MQLGKWLSKWNLDSLSINASFLSADLKFNDADRKAAWELYVELITRVTTQTVEQEQGDEASALASVYELFPRTREILKQHGPDCADFAKIAVVVLNQVVRPFLAKWHRRSVEGVFADPDQRTQFRAELEGVREKLRNYTRLLGDIAGVEDFTQLEQV
jgi:hypothetical protein